MPPRSRTRPDAPTPPEEERTMSLKRLYHSVYYAGSVRDDRDPNPGVWRDGNAGLVSASALFPLGYAYAGTSVTWPYLFPPHRIPSPVVPPLLAVRAPSLGPEGLVLFPRPPPLDDIIVADTHVIRRSFTTL